MIEKKRIERAIQAGQLAIKEITEFKNETYLAVVLYDLFRAESWHSIDSGPRATVQKAAPPKPYSAAELFASRLWSTEVQKVALAGYFIEKYNNLSGYSIGDIRDVLISAKVPVPANINLAVLKAIQRGWMMEIPGQGQKTKVWALTQTGVQWAEGLSNHDQ